MKKKKIIAMIPARFGSKRLKLKNLALLDNKPLIWYVINQAKKAKIFDQIILNSDSKIFKDIADKNKIDFFLRSKKYANSKAKSDDVVNNFLENYDCDIIVWLNPICPLQNSREIRQVIKYFILNNLNSLITTSKVQTHTIYKNQPINFKINGKFEQTQNLEPVYSMVYSIMMWNSKSFINSMRKTGNAILHGKVGYYPVSKDSSVMIKTEEDLKMAELRIQSAKKNKSYKLRYFHK
jgi:CMP-N-acetylneuraminic acid synthetase